MDVLVSFGYSVWVKSQLFISCSLRSVVTLDHKTYKERQLKQGHISTHCMGTAGLARLYKRTLSLHVPPAAGSYSRFPSSFSASHPGSCADSHGVFWTVRQDGERNGNRDHLFPRQIRAQQNFETLKAAANQSSLFTVNPTQLEAGHTKMQADRCFFSVSSNILLFRARK